MTAPNPDRATRTKVIRAVCRVMGGSLYEILSPHRGRPATARRRWVAMHVFRHLTEPPRTYTAVGPLFNRDRTSVAHAERKVFAEMTRTDLPRRDNLQTTVEQITRLLT
jgi:chromosomal replication initiation ATPase DnaA